MKHKMIIEPTKTGYSAYSDKLPVVTVGGDLEELKANMLEALNLYFEEVKQPAIDAAQITAVMDMPSFFAFYRMLNVKAFAEHIGMSQSLLAQYIGGQKKPSPTQTKRILSGIQQLGRELAAVRFLL